MAQKDPPQGVTKGLFLCQLTVLRALAKNLARAATKTGLLSSLISINMKDVSIVSPFFGASSSQLILKKSITAVAVDNNV
jgi:hypothetical protein